MEEDFFLNETKRGAHKSARDICFFNINLAASLQKWGMGEAAAVMIGVMENLFPEEMKEFREKIMEKN